MMKKTDNTKNICISICAFCDPLLWYTVGSAIRKAYNPNRLHFVIIDQSFNLSEEDRKVSKICKIDYVRIDPRESLGVCWARAMAMKYAKEEDYFLQIDAHTLFDACWDQILIKTYHRIKSATQAQRCILSTRPMPFEIVDGQPIRSMNVKNTILLKPRTTVIDLRAPVIYYDAIVAPDGRVYRASQISAAFLFLEGDVVFDIPYDPLMYFHGEEQGYSLRLFCAGLDVWHIPDVPLYHLYKTRSAGEPPLHWDAEFEDKRLLKWTELKTRADKRLAELYMNKIDAPYGLRNNRLVSDFLKISGLEII